MVFPHRPTDRQSERGSESFRPPVHDRQPGDHGQPPTRMAASGVAGSAGLWPASASPRCHLQSGSQIEGEHQLEKLEFALAVALTRGDHGRSCQLRDQIEALGGNREEPGT